MPRLLKHQRGKSISEKGQTSFIFPPLYIITLIFYKTRLFYEKTVIFSARRGNKLGRQACSGRVLLMVLLVAEKRAEDNWLLFHFSNINTHMQTHQGLSCWMSSKGSNQYATRFLLFFTLHRAIIIHIRWRNHESSFLKALPNAKQGNICYYWFVKYLFSIFCHFWQFTFSEGSE